MPPFPLALEPLLGKAGMYAVFLAIGFAFGYVLETGGFNHAPTLAAQFYFKDLRVFKVFFTAICVNMVLIFGASAIGLLDYNLIWVNPTYLWSGIIGGLIMGAGFIIGGFCPGTSLVAFATLKIDGIFFVLGGLVGVFLFGETVNGYEDFFNGSYYGRLTLMDVFDLPTGVIVIAVVLMALTMFWLGEKAEKTFGGKEIPKSMGRKISAAALLGIAILVFAVGQPTTDDKWNRIAAEKELELAARQVQIEPAELLHTMYDASLQVVLIDMRNESDYNQFHLRDARRVESEDLLDLVAELRLTSEANTVHVVMSNDEAMATEAWKTLVAESVPNVYILQGGINDWITTFNEESPEIIAAPSEGMERLKFRFPGALGERYDAAHPSILRWEELEYTPKIEMELKRGPSGGGCG